MNKPVVKVIIGPTAAGKTDFAIDVARKINGAVISADSRQLYVGMNIGTAKPKEIWGGQLHEILESEIIEGVPHFLFNIATPDNPLTLSQWQVAAKKVLEHLTAQNIPVVLAGGTMLYVDSLVDWYSIPEVKPNQALRDELETEDVAVLYEQLIAKDPASASFIEHHHKQRIIRALEVMTETKKPFSESRKQKDAPYTFEITGIFPHLAGGLAGWDVLKTRVQTRIEKMFEESLLKETKNLQAAYGASLPLLQTMNYKQAADVLSKAQTQEAAIEDAIRANLRYARRQMNWWKRRKEINWINAS